ncbi:MAG: phage tail protein, partial [Isosphaeraceae bacterium]
MEPIVELEGVNGEWFNLTDGDQGIWLGTDLKGIYDAPVKAVYEEPGNYPGARYLNHRLLRRDITFGVWILNDRGSNSWLSRDSLWAKAWAFNKDCKLHITTQDSGHRYLKLRKLEAIQVDTTTDPNGNTANQAVMTCVSPDPFWYEDDVVYTAVTQKDTRFQPTLLDGTALAPFDSLPQETLQITVDPGDGKG